MEQKLLSKLLKAQDYLEFLKLHIKELEELKGRGVKAALSRKAGFASRSYLSEVISGKKGLSRDTMKKLKSSLKLQGTLGKYFELLVISSHPNIDPKISPASIPAKLKLLKAELLDSSRPAPARSHLNLPELFQIYAALGSREDGADIEAIKKRLKAPESKIRKSLNIMLTEGWIRQEENRFYVLNSIVDDYPHQDDLALSKMIKKVTHTINRQSDELVRDKRNLNYYCAFSMDHSELPQLKKALHEAITDILDQYQVDEGDCVEQIYLSLFSNPLEG